MKEKLARINELARIKKERELTKEELKERDSLRNAYLKNLRRSLENQLKSVKVIDPEGKDVTPNKVKQLQKREKDKK